MKKFFEKPHNLLFIVSAAIFLQFLASVICLYLQVLNFRFVDWPDYVYTAYCFMGCVILVVFMLKKQKESRDSYSVKLWISGIFLYAFSEIIFFLKVQYMAYLGYSLYSDTVFNLWDNQHIYRLYVCIAVIFLIYGAMFVLEKKKIYAGFAGVNLFLFGLLTIFMPDGESLLVAGDESVFEVTVIQIFREAGIVLLMINIFIFAMYKLYNYKED